MNPPQAMHHSTPGSSFWSLITKLLLLLGAFCLMSIFVYLFGQVSGEEFCPQRFQLQSFSYQVIPWTHIQITPSVTSQISTNNDLSKYLRKNQLLGETAKQPQRWDLARMDRTGRVYRGDSHILVEYLSHTGTTNTEGSWLQWSERHPRMAEVLWPEVARIAHENLYVLVPDLFQLARSSDSPSDLKAKISLFLSQQVTLQAQATRRMGDLQRASQLDTLATHYANPSGSSNVD